MSSATHIDTIIFDVGNVLYRWEIRALYAKLIDDADELEWFIANVITDEWHFQHDAGRPFAETSRELSAQYPRYAELIAQFGPRFNETVPGAVQGMEGMIAQLARNNVPLFGITNFSDEFWEPFMAERMHVFGHFKDIVVSGTEKLVKPDPKIYRLAIQRFDINPAQAIFIDDRQENVDGAIACGLNAHLFRDAETLRKVLVDTEMLST